MGTSIVLNMDSRGLVRQSNVYGTHHGRRESSEAEMATGERLVSSDNFTKLTSR
jgi:hypothetical protein